MAASGCAARLAHCLEYGGAEAEALALRALAALLSGSCESVRAVLDTGLARLLPPLLEGPNAATRGEACGAIASLAASTTSDRCVVTFDSGATCEVELSAAGEATVTSPSGAAEPPTKRTRTTVTHPDGTVVSVVTEEGAAAPSWRMLPGLMPCGNHDIFAAECNGKIYTTGGALWW